MRCDVVGCAVLGWAVWHCDVTGTERYGVVGCGVLRRGVAWGEVARCVAMWRYAVRCGEVWRDVAWSGMKRCGAAWCAVVRRGVAWRGVAWSGVVGWDAV